MKISIAPSEWNNVIKSSNFSGSPDWFEKLNRNSSIMVIIKLLKMMLLEYEIKLIQTTYSLANNYTSKDYIEVSDS